MTTILKHSAILTYGDHEPPHLETTYNKATTQYSSEQLIDAPASLIWSLVIHITNPWLWLNLILSFFRNIALPPLPVYRDFSFSFITLQSLILPPLCNVYP